MTPPRQTRVIATSGRPGALIVDDEGLAWAPAATWLHHLAEQGLSPFTIRAYAQSVHRFIRYARAAQAEPLTLDAHGARRFVRWSSQVPRPQARRRAPYSPETISQTLAATRAFLRFCEGEGEVEQQNWLVDDVSEESPRLIGDSHNP